MARLASSLVRRRARDLLIRAWVRRESVWDPPVTADGIFPLAVRLLAENVLNVTFEEPEQIIPNSSLPNHLVPIETAGFIDRERNRIVVAQKFRAEYRRFTGAHEIGHWVLHPGIKYHRDRPLQGSERWDPPVTADGIFPLAVGRLRLLAENVLNVTFEEPEQIIPNSSLPNHLVPIETAGFIDRERNRIVVAQKFRAEYRRFTGAHEIGHWVLHPGIKELQEDHPDSLWAGQVQAVLQTGLAVRDRCNDGELSEHGLASVRGRLVAQLGRLIDAPPPLDDTERFAGIWPPNSLPCFSSCGTCRSTRWHTRHGADSQQVLAATGRGIRSRYFRLGTPNANKEY